MGSLGVCCRLHRFGPTRHVEWQRSRSSTRPVREGGAMGMNSGEKACRCGLRLHGAGPRETVLACMRRAPGTRASTSAPGAATAPPGPLALRQKVHRHAVPGVDLVAAAACGRAREAAGPKPSTPLVHRCVRRTSLRPPRRSVQPRNDRGPRAFSTVNRTRAGRHHEEGHDHRQGRPPPRVHHPQALGTADVPALPTRGAEPRHDVAPASPSPSRPRSRTEAQRTPWTMR